MITDNIKNAELYYGLGENIKTALEFLKNYKGKADEKADIIVNDYVMVKCRPYVTKDESDCKYEAHEKHIDIHYVVSGCEMIGYAPISSLRTIARDEAKDMVYLEGKGTNIPQNAGDFMITYPCDAHEPCIKNGSPVFCAKLIAKIKL